MQYYKVPADLQDKPCYKSNKANRIPNGYYLIANELLTPSECKRINAPIDLLESVTIKKTACFTMFGARFERNEMN